MAEDSTDNPDLDSIALDAEYYDSMGIDKATLAELKDQILPDSADPYGVYFDGESSLMEQLPEGSQEIFEEAEPYGPEAVLLAGFRAEEVAVVRNLIDQCGGAKVKVVLCSDAMLQGTVAEALAVEEPDWESPRPAGAPRGGSWGSSRCMLLSGLYNADQVLLIELLEGSGFPDLGVALASEDNRTRPLGEVMAQALAYLRENPLPSGHLEPGHEWTPQGRREVEELLARRAAEHAGRRSSVHAEAEAEATPAAAPDSPRPEACQSGPNRDKAEPLPAAEAPCPERKPAALQSGRVGENPEGGTVHQEAYRPVARTEVTGQLVAESTGASPLRVTAAAPASPGRAAGERQQTGSGGTPPGEPGEEVNLLDLIAAGGDVPDSVWQAGGVGDAVVEELEEESSVTPEPRLAVKPLLDAITRALQAGVPAHELKRLIDDASARLQLEQPQKQQQEEGPPELPSESLSADSPMDTAGCSQM